MHPTSWSLGTTLCHYHRCGQFSALQHLTKWLQVAPTRTQQGPSSSILFLEAPLADVDLISHQANVLQQALPALSYLLTAWNLL
jgi:hypothetical protein